MAGSERGDLGCRGEGWVAWKCMSASQRGGRGGLRRRISPSYNVYVMELDRAAGHELVRDAQFRAERRNRGNQLLRGVKMGTTTQVQVSK